MIPDKIYVRKEEMGDVLSLDATTWDNGGEQFIRKDALLEWAKEKIAKGTIDEWDKGYVQCLNDLIDKLNNF